MDADADADAGGVCGIDDYLCWRGRANASNTLTINYPLETFLWNVPTAHRNRCAMEAACDTATALVITVYRGAGKYDRAGAARKLYSQI